MKRRHSAVPVAPAVLVVLVLMLLSLLLASPARPRHTWVWGYWIEIGTSFRVGPVLPRTCRITEQLKEASP